MESTMSSQKKIKILFVDDEIDFLQAIAERLTLKDFDVITASNGKDAVTAAENDLFDVAIVDFRMPGMDGTQVLKTLKDRHRYLEIIKCFCIGMN